MRHLIVSAILIVGVFSSLPSSAKSLFGSCDGASKEPRPDWVSRDDYSLADYYVGVGSAEIEGKSKDEQMEAAKNNAKSSLVQRIEVTIRAENDQNTRVGSQGVQSDVQSKLSVKAEEVLRDLQLRGRWKDPDTCVQYVLLAITKISVAQSKREKLMKQRMEKVKNLLAEGTDREKNRDINIRRKYLEDAQSLLTETDFSLLPEELKKEIYVKRLSEALAQVNKAVSSVKGRMAVFALDQGGLRADVIAQILDQLRSNNNNADRLMSECNNVDDCIKRANEGGFSMLALLKTNGQVTTSQMGALKGTLTISRTVYDIESRKVVKGPDTVSAQVIGWSNEELDWHAAAEKAMQNLK